MRVFEIEDAFEDDKYQRISFESTLNSIENVNKKSGYIEGRHSSLTNAELQSKLVKMGKQSRQKFNKLASIFSKSAKNKCNQAALTCSSILSLPMVNTAEYNSSTSYYTHKDYENGGGQARYEEAKELQNVDTLKKSRYQKAYKSFKSAMRRNSSANSRRHHHDNCDLSEHTMYSTPMFEKHNYESHLPRLDLMPELRLFQNDYSYEGNGFKSGNEFSYDHSVYPYVKNLNHSRRTSKGAKNVRNTKKFDFRLLLLLNWLF